MRGAGCGDSCHFWLPGVYGASHARLHPADCTAVHPGAHQLLPPLQVLISAHITPAVSTWTAEPILLLEGFLEATC